MKLMKETRRAKMRLSQKMYLFTAMATSALCAVPAPIASAKGKTGKKLVDDLMKEKGNGTFDNATKAAKGIGGSVYGMMRVVGTVCLVVSLVVLGLSLGLHAGNTQKTAQAKDSMVNIVIGGSLLFGGVSVLAIIIGFAGSI